MRRFADLYWRLDGTTSITEKVQALRDYFAAAHPDDAACALAVLGGARQSRAVPLPLLRRQAAAVAGIPAWLLEECYAQTGDLAETLALVLPPSDRLPPPDDPGPPSVTGDLGLAGHVARLAGLRGQRDEEVIGRFLVDTWRVLAPRERIVWHKLLTGGCRVGVSRSLLARALADLAGVDPATMIARLVARAPLDGAAFTRLLDATDAGPDGLRPYPFFLAAPLDGPVEALGPRSDWQAEWKWDGIRAQLVQRDGAVAVWTRGEDLATEAFPEIVLAAAGLPTGTVLDGELLAVRGGHLLGFAPLQRRSGRRRVTRSLLVEVPCVFVAYDIVEADGEDLRPLALTARRARMERVLAAVGAEPAAFLPPGATAPAGGPTATLWISPEVPGVGWDDLAARRVESRQRGVEGLILKRRDSPYGSGRTRGDWWKWKIEPLEIDAVLLYAQSGHGRRAALHTDYTLGVWHEGRLVTVAKAYSGLSDTEIVEVDRIVRATTRERHGPVRIVEPSLVFQIAFEGVAPSARHKAGLALRFPRIVRWRRDKGIADAGGLADLARLCRPPLEVVP
ncbi:MAG: ATP-dependent DNA ligase [Pirellulales bacterium]